MSLLAQTPPSNLQRDDFNAQGAPVGLPAEVQLVVDAKVSVARLIVVSEVARIWAMTTMGQDLSMTNNALTRPINGLDRRSRWHEICLLHRWK